MIYGFRLYPINALNASGCQIHYSLSIDDPPASCRQAAMSTAAATP
jgi:hypothetical protein